MYDFLKIVFANLGLPLAVFSAFFLVSKQLDEKIKPSSRRQLTRSLHNMPEKHPQSVVGVTTTTLDYLYRVRPKVVFGVTLDIPSFTRCALFSVLTSSVLLLVFFTYLYEGNVQYNFPFCFPWQESASRGWCPSLIDKGALWNTTLNFIDPGESVLGSRILPIIVLLSTIIVANPIIDFVAIIETRYLISFIQRNYPRSNFVGRNSTLAMFFVMALDFLLTSALVLFLLPQISNIVYRIFLYFTVEESGFQIVEQLDVGTINHPFEPAVIGQFVTKIPNFYNYYFGQMPEGINGAFIYSTYLTSIWIWLILFGLLIFKPFLLFPQFIKFLTRHFNISRAIVRNPFQSITTVLIFFIIGGKVCVLVIS